MKKPDRKLLASCCAIYRAANHNTYELTRPKPSQLSVFYQRNHLAKKINTARIVILSFFICYLLAFRILRALCEAPLFPTVPTHDVTRRSHHSVQLLLHSCHPPFQLLWFNVISNSFSSATAPPVLRFYKSSCSSMYQKALDSAS